MGVRLPSELLLHSSLQKDREFWPKRRIGNLFTCGSGRSRLSQSRTAASRPGTRGVPVVLSILCPVPSPSPPELGKKRASDTCVEFGSIPGTPRAGDGQLEARGPKATFSHGSTGKQLSNPSFWPKLSIFLQAAVGNRRVGPS